MKNLFIVYFSIFLLSLMFLPGTDALARTYATNFSATENPISESGNWINGKDTGTYWSNVRTNGTIAYGTQNGSGGYDDSTAVLSPGSWGPNQTVQATVYTSGLSNDWAEVELRLRTTITSGSISGYEINCGVWSGDPYCQVNKWSGAHTGTFWTLLDARTTAVWKTGDVLKATITGTSSTVITLYRAPAATPTVFSTLFMVTDNSSPFTTGNPGIGFYNKGNTNSNFGFSYFMATDGSEEALSPPQNLKIVK